MRTEIIGISDRNCSFGMRFWRSVRWFLLIYSFFLLLALINYGFRFAVVIAMSVFLIPVIVHGLKTSVNVLYKIYDDGNGNLEIETLHFSKIKVVVHPKQDVKVNVMLDVTMRYYRNMIRIDVKRRTYFVQRPFLPWTRELIDEMKELVNKGVLSKS